MRVFHPPESAVEAAMVRLKQDGEIHPNARFNYGAEDGLRTEVTWRDYDFQHRMGRSVLDEEIVDAALEMLVSINLVPADSGYDKDRFDGFRADIKEKFKGSWTSITPVMERLMYMLTAVKRPKRLVELGSFWGNTLAWFAGPCIGRSPEFVAERVYGVEIDEKMTEQARENFGRLERCEAVELIGEDAAIVLDRIEAPIDFLYLEAKDERCKNDYLYFLRQAYDKLPPGAWVIAHDSTAVSHRKEMEGYLAWVRDHDNFSESICFDVDALGLELSVK